MYTSTIATWAAQHLDSGARSKALRELPSVLEISTGTVTNHWHGRSKVRDSVAHKYVSYFKGLGYKVAFEDLFKPVAIPQHEAA